MHWACSKTAIPINYFEGVMPLGNINYIENKILLIMPSLFVECYEIYIISAYQ